MKRTYIQHGLSREEVNTLNIIARLQSIKVHELATNVLRSYIAEWREQQSKQQGVETK